MDFRPFDTMDDFFAQHSGKKQISQRKCVFKITKMHLSFHLYSPKTPQWFQTQPPLLILD